jgi:hypothetical protein
MSYLILKWAGLHLETDIDVQATVQAIGSLDKI